MFEINILSDIDRNHEFILFTFNNLIINIAGIHMFFEIKETIRYVWDYRAIIITLHNKTGYINDFASSQFIILENQHLITNWQLICRSKGK